MSSIPGPRQPVEHVIGVTVVAERGADADALAKVCGVLEPEESLRLVNSLPGGRLPDHHGRRPDRPGAPAGSDWNGRPWHARDGNGPATKTPAASAEADR